MRVKYYYSSKLARKNRKPDNINAHKIPFPTLAREVIKKSDILLEVLDARFIDKTRNRELEEEARKQGKKIIFVLNKADLISVSDLKLNYDLSSLIPYVLFSSKNKVGRARLRQVINIEASKIKFEQVRVGVIGYPNTGKSTLINILAGGKRAGTSPRAGFTKSIQKIRFNKKIIILDSPGVISEDEINSINARIVKKQAEIGVKNYDKVKYPDLIINEIMKEHPTIFDKFYGVDSEGDVEILLEKLGRKWNFLKKKGEADYDRTARKILKDWQEGKIR